MKKTISILVTSVYDDDCKNIISILSDQNDFCIAGVEKDESGTIIKTANIKPDVLILNLQSPGIGGDELAPIIHRRSPDTAIVLLCDKDEDIYAGLALKAGISGFLLKDTDTDKLVPVVKIVFYGGYYISASIIIRVFTAITFMHYFPPQILEQKHDNLELSPAERGIITEIANGLSDTDIAKLLNFNTNSIRNCILTLKRKTKLNNRIQIAIYSLVNGYIRFDQLVYLKNNRQIYNDTIQ
ncbi:MAG: response regulator transcription factor [Treponema sp.]|nr:response regulator transcription factor [Treponema sp.]